MVLVHPPGIVLPCSRGRIWSRELLLELYLDGYSAHALLISWAERLSGMTWPGVALRGGWLRDE